MNTPVTHKASRRFARPGAARTLPCAGRARGGHGITLTRDFLSPGVRTRTTEAVVEHPAG